MSHKFIENITTFFLCAILILFFGAEVILNLTPPISRDALIHHLAVPKLWLTHGGYYEIPWADYAYYPMTINLLYLFCLYLKNDLAPKFIHLAFGMGTGLLIYFYLKQKLGRHWGLLGMVIFITTPIVVWLSTSAYIDLGMTFFTTAGVLAYIKWRDSEYSTFKWLLISSICMGVAVGSKYNALIAWFILSMLIMLSYVRDTHKQLAALKYGIFFSGIAAFVASPWYLKNYLETGNPFYPLFAGFFQSLHHQPVQKILHHQLAQRTGEISFFKMRHVMYGESFWETLLIPIRMFFQGKDTSYQYFQGALNPIFILFSPFILLNKRYAKDKFSFAIFSIFFIITAYFLTAKQVRYILPVLPFLSILAVMGIKDLVDKMEAKMHYSSWRLRRNLRSISGVLIFAGVAILLLINLFYLKNRIDIVNPYPYVSGRETRDVFLEHHLLHYKAVKFINKNLPDDAIVFTIFLGRRGYYLNRNYKNEKSFGMNTLNHMINSSTNEKKFVEYVRSTNVTHILMRTDLVNNYLRDNFSQKESRRFIKLTKKYWKKIYKDKFYAVWDIRVRR